MYLNQMMLYTAKTQKNVIDQILFFVGIFVISFTPSITHAETACAVTPFSTTLARGGSVTLSVDTGLSQYDSAFDLQLGNLPTSVEGGFVSNNLALNFSKTASLSIRARDDAQMGSFMIPILIRVAAPTPSGIDQSICQFNLVVVNATTVASPASTVAPSLIHITPTLNTTVSAGTLPTNVSLFTVVPSTVATSTVSTSSPSQVSVSIVFDKNLARGSRGSEVLRLQTALKILGYLPPSVELTGYYGVATESAVKAYQAAHNIEIAGTFGPKTRKALEMSLKK